MSLDYLINRGYTIDGYGNDAVYLRDVNEMSYYWPDATLYYGAGGLARSEFLYSTSYPIPYVTIHCTQGLTAPTARLSTLSGLAEYCRPHGLLPIEVT